MKAMEKFLKTHAVREEARQKRASAGISSNTHDRLHFEDQATACEQSVMQSLSDGDVRTAQNAVNTFKAVVQDANSSHGLTAYEMAKSNAMLSRLQDLINAKSGPVDKSRGFRFSSKPLKGATAIVGDITAAPPLMKVEEERCHNTSVYGKARDKTISIGSSKAVFLKECENCEILILPIAGSVFISDCKKCKIYVACHQLRLKNCSEVDVYVCCSSTPIIECCTEMRFGPYSCWTGLLQSHVGNHSYTTHEEWVQHVGELHDPDRIRDSYNRVDDFQWLRKTPSPHWKVMPPEEWVLNAQTFLSG